MSDLLDKAIVDAKTLREVATRNAESLIVEKYAQQVKEAITALLEKDEEDFNNPELGLPPSEPTLDGLDGGEMTSGAPDSMGMDTSNPMDMGSDSSLLGATSAETSVADSQVPMASEVGGPGDDEEIEIDFSGLQDSVDNVPSQDVDLTQLSSELPSPEDTANEVPVTSETPPGPEVKDTVATTYQEDPALNFENYDMEEEKDLTLEDVDESLLAELMEAFKVGYEPALDGWLGSNPIEKEEYRNGVQAVQAAHEASETPEEEKKEDENDEWMKERVELQESIKVQTSKLDKVNKSLSALQKENMELKNNLKTVLTKLNESNVSNAKLLYMNRTLENSSLNERQKKVFVEQLEKVDSVEQAKVIFETLNLTGLSGKSKKPQSLNEVVTKPSTTFPFMRQREEREVSDPLRDRMKTLAGIKK